MGRTTRACGPAYDAVVEMNPGGEFTEDAAYKAVLCYNDLFSASSQRAQRNRRPRRPPRAATAPARRPRAARAPTASPHGAARPQPREQGMLRAFTRYVCFVRRTTPSAAPRVKTRAR
jgi:hypothetical protein